VVRDEKASSALATDRYDYMRTRMAEGVMADDFVFRGLATDPMPQAPVDQPKNGVPGGSIQFPPSSGPASGTFAASAASSAPAGRVQLIQVTSGNDVATARETQRRLRDAGFDAYWESVPTAQGEAVRVRVAVDTARASVDNTLAELRKLGFAPTLIAQ
jgi:cell division septation protein DedD